MAHGLSSQHTCNGCDRLASMLIGQLTPAKHHLDMKLKNKQPGVSAALVSIDILCLYFIQHLIPRIYSSHVLWRPLSAIIRLWDKQLISTDTGSTKEGCRWTTPLTPSPIQGKHSTHHTLITTSPEAHQQEGTPIPQSETRCPHHQATRFMNSLTNPIVPNLLKEPDRAEQPSKTEMQCSI